MFITFEGPEGAGKSTALRVVAESLTKQGRDVLTTREPGATDFGQKVRELILHGEEMPAEAELFLFLADRANHVRRVIRPALAEGKTVLCDRFADSTFVYQAAVRGLDHAFIHQANRFATGGLVPNLTFLLDLDPEIGLARLKSKDRLDSQPLAFHQAVRKGFLDLARAEPKRWRRIDAEGPSDSVIHAILAEIDAFDHPA